MIPVHGTSGDAAQTASVRTRIDLEPSWLAELGGEFEQPYMRSLREFLRAEKRAGKTIYPAAAPLSSGEPAD